MMVNIFLSLVILQSLPRNSFQRDFSDGIVRQATGSTFGAGTIPETDLARPSQKPEGRNGFWDPSPFALLQEGFTRDTADHKPLWPLNWRDILTVFFGAISAFIAASAGLGGGGVLVPLFLLILGEACPPFLCDSTLHLSLMTRGHTP